ncbi:MAG: hypothetical protein PVH61_04180 [Candidatus Aminicenantes bacterium]|jgi:hypothetical protein
MNLKRRLSGILCVMVCVGLVTIGGCKKSADAQLIPAGALLEYNGCKQFLAGTSGQLDGFAPGQNDDCIEYQYNGTNTLVLRHINAGFNCCPGEITAEIDFNNSLITISEREQEQGCKCLCLFDLDYELINLAPGVYTLRIIELYVEGGDQELELTLELLSATSGTFCLQRNYYPWGQ